MYMNIPKGFFPIEDTGFIVGSTEAAPDISIDAMSELQLKMINIVRSDPAVEYVSSAIGFGNIAVNLFGTAAGSLTHEVRALGIAGIAANVGGNDNDVRAGAPGAVGNVAVALFGSFNQVESGPGPFALAGSVGQTGKVIQKVGPGFNINGLRIPNTAAANNAMKAKSTAATASRAAASKSGGQSRSGTGSTKR